MASGVMNERVMSAVASGVASRYGVKVTVSGSGAYSTLSAAVRNGRTVYIPQINIPAEVRKPTPEAMVLLRGYLDHEAAHVRWTDWQVPSWTAGWEYLKAMLNVVEDVRVERLMSGTFAGSRQNIRDIAVLLFGGDRWKEQLKVLAGRTGKLHAAAMLSLSWALYRLRSIDVPELGQGLKALAGAFGAARPDAMRLMEGALSGWLASRGWPESTEGSLSLAKALADAFLASGRDVMEEDGGEDGEEDGGAQDAQEEAAEAAGQALEEAGMDPGEAEIYAELAARAAGQDACDSAGSTAAANDAFRSMSKDVPGLSSLGRAVSGMLDALDPDQHALADAAVHGETAAFMPAETALQEGVLEPWTPEDLKAASRLCSGLGTRLASLLQTQARTMKGTGRTGRKLDGSSLWRAAARDGRVFRSAAVRRDVSASVLLLVDASGSMHGAYAALASAAMLAVMNALDAVKGVDAGACAFTAADASRPMHAVVRLPGDRTPAAMLPRPGACGCTDVAGSMRHCAPLIPADSPRRIMLVVSDGLDEAGPVRKAEQDLTAAGILVAGVGIGSDMLSKALSHCRTANEPGDIPGAVFGALREVLLGSPS